MAALAILPAIVLITYIYKHDTVEKEPAGLLAKLFFLGMASTIPAAIIESVGDGFLLSLFPGNSLLYHLLENFLVVALVEESFKYLILKRKTWRSSHFNYTFDAVVYAVVVSLGFATLENILYVMQGGFGTAITRAIFSVPGHAIDAVFMGYFYGLAKQSERLGDVAKSSKNLLLALVVPICIHGFYDFAIATSSFLVFLAFEVVITIIAIRRVRKLSSEDAPI